jgi:hypothetical protein
MILIIPHIWLLLEHAEKQANIKAAGLYLLAACIQYVRYMAKKAG